MADFAPAGTLLKRVTSCLYQQPNGWPTSCQVSELVEVRLGVLDLRETARLLHGQPLPHAACHHQSGRVDGPYAPGVGGDGPTQGCDDLQPQGSGVESGVAQAQDALSNHF